MPLEAVLKGIDLAFESYGRSRRGAGKPLKSLAYCTDAVLEAAEERLEAAAGKTGSPLRKAQNEPFSREELRTYFARNVAQLKRGADKHQQAKSGFGAALRDIAKSLEDTALLLDSPGALDLEDLERRLTVLDEKLYSLLTTHAAEDLMLKLRRELDSQLAAYRRKMKAEQLAMIERQFLQKKLLEEFALPRLSLFYMS